MPAVEEDGNVVEPVEEDHGLLLKDEEDSVNQLRNLRVDEEGDPEADGIELVVAEEPGSAVGTGGVCEALREGRERGLGGGIV